MAELVAYQANRLGVAGKDWIVGPMAGLKSRLTAATANGHDTTPPIIGDETNPIVTDGAEVAGEGGVTA